MASKRTTKGIKKSYVHGRKSQGDESPPEFAVGGRSYRLSPQIFVVFQNFKRPPWIRPPQISIQIYATGYVNHNVRQEMYCDALVSKKSTSAKFRNFRSSCHKIQTVNFVKKCLSPYDDKRYVLYDGISTLAYGHWSTA
jgi:hypothetical protein